MSRILAIVWVAILLIGFLVGRAYLKTQPDFVPKGEAIQQRLLTECAPLGQIGDKAVQDCERRVRGSQGQ